MMVPIDLSMVDYTHGVAKADVPHEWPGIWNPAVAILKKVQEEGCTYEGPVNPITGLRNGYGKITYRGGTTYYEGQFIEGLKHGPGQEKSQDGSFYQGLFENDLKHGEGKLTLPDGRTIMSTWLYGRKHGKGIIVDSGDTTHSNCVFYHDMENWLDQTKTKCYDNAWLNIFFCLVFIFSIGLALFFDFRVFWLTGIAYFAIFIDTCCSSTRQYLNHVMSAN